MIKKILIWLRGYLILAVKGASCDRFINICMKNNLNIWNIFDDEDCKKFYISQKSYKELEQYIKKTGVELKIINKKGLPNIFYKYKKRKIFILGLILFIGLIYSFSFFIWDINISGEEIYTDEQIIKKLKEHNISIGTPKSDINCSELEKMLRDDYADIAWISCELKGTRLNISINETILPENIKENITPCNIVAVKDGIITDIYVESGTKVMNKGDEVKKGDILITGAINLYNDYDELIETSYVPANGNVYAIVSYDYNDIFELSHYEKEYTGKSKNYYGLNIAGNIFEPYKPKAKYDNYDITQNDIRIKLGEAFYLPVSLRKNHINEYEPVLMTYTNEEAFEKAHLKLNYYIDKLNKKGVEILENNVKIEISDECCVACGTIVTKELIGIPADITIMNQGE
ncbi:MAG: sporulation protein YqfD [Lachnospiraceae bacterium]|nr:sporulation protein YqfD [Lachnospiraceae bacterium]